MRYLVLVILGSFSFASASISLQSNEDVELMMLNIEKYRLIAMQQKEKIELLEGRINKFRNENDIDLLDERENKLIELLKQYNVEVQNNVPGARKRLKQVEDKIITLSQIGSEYNKLLGELVAEGDNLATTVKDMQELKSKVNHARLSADEPVDYDDKYRAKHLEEINKADGFKTLFGTRRPIKLDNGVHYHGWLYNEELDAAVIQYTYAGKLFESYTDNLAENILAKWRGDLGSRFRKIGFKDIAVMVTEVVTTKVYSSRQNRWYTVDDYLVLNFE